jgi:hypothetical protein
MTKKMDRNIVEVESVELGEWGLLQLTLFDDGNIRVHLMTDEEPQKNVFLDVPKKLFFYAALRLLEKDVSRT